jgi:hypothetical protein
MPTLRRALLVAAVLTLVGALVGLGDVISHPRPIHFAKGKASALLQGLLPKVDEAAPQTAAAPQEYLLHARAGQVITIHFTGLDQGAAFSISCPGGGRMDVGRSPLWSSVLPVSGDYRVVVERRREGAPVVPYALEVGVAGRPGPVESHGVTGFYQFGKSGYPSLEVLELPEGQIKFVLYSQSGGVVANGPAQIRQISGIVPLRDGTAVHQVAGCKRTLSFTRNGVRILEEGECGAKENLATFDGAYRKVSPCGYPAKPTTAGQAVVGG